MERTRPTVLVVDDSKDVAHVIELVLGSQCDVVICHCGPDALATLDQLNVDTVVLDVMMPGMSGFEVCERIKTNEYTSDVPVIFLTSVDDPQEVQHGLDLGAVDYIDKPFKPDELLERVLHHARSHLNSRGGFDRDSGTVLIVEDDDLMLKSISEYLSLQGHYTVPMTSVENVVALLDRIQPDVVLLDVVLPGQDGYSIATQIKQSTRHRNVPVILMSGHADRDAVIRGLEIGAEDFVRKPFEAAELGARVRNFVRFKAAMDLLRHSSDFLRSHDHVTGLVNRIILEQRINQILRSGGQLAVVIVDIDGFHKVNDGFGEKVAQMLLRSIANRLVDSVPTATLVGRLESDVFAVVVETYALERVRDFARRILQAMNQAFYIGRQEVFFSASVGIALGPKHGSSYAPLVRNAMLAERNAKNAGGRRVHVFDGSMDSDPTLKLTLESDLFSAYERDELVLYYQPKVDLSTGKISGAEALLRWNHPKHGMVSPGVFIPIAEQSHAIIGIGKWVYEKAFQQWRELREMGHGDISLAVNLSPKQFFDANLVRDLSHIIEAGAMAPDQLELEITESCSMLDVDHSQKTLRALHDIGVSVSIDDFGTGYSSLVYLTRFPLEVLKIDREFVRELPNDKGACVVAETIVSLAQSLALKTVAEGVETREQLSFLETLGCDAIQGFLFSKPLPFEQFVELLDCDLMAKIS